MPGRGPWLQLGDVIGGEAVGDSSGASVSLSTNGAVVAIGASQANGANGDGSGHVRVLAWSGTAWEQRGDDIDGEAAGDSSGISVSLSSDGNIVAIGAHTNKGDDDTLLAGHVRVFAWDGTAWVQRGGDIDGEFFSTSGESVSLSSDGAIVAIGARFYNASRGHVRVYASQQEQGQWSWSQRGDDIDGEAAGDWSSSSVSLSSDGATLAIGAPANDGSGDNAGHVRVYGWSGTAWEQRGTDIDGEAAEDDSGRSVSLSSDGNIVAIGAPDNSGSGTNAGHVRVYGWSGTGWEQRGADIDGEAAGDKSGTSVSLSFDGSVVTVGAAGGGYVRVHSFDGGAWVQCGDDMECVCGDGMECAEDDRCGNAVSLSGDGSSVAVGAPNTFGAASPGRVHVYGGPTCSSS